MLKISLFRLLAVFAFFIFINNLGFINLAYASEYEALEKSAIDLEQSIVGLVGIDVGTRTSLLNQLTTIKSMLADLKNQASVGSVAPTDLEDISYIVNNYNDTNLTITSIIYLKSSTTTITSSYVFPDLARATQPTARLLQMRKKVLALYANNFATTTKAIDQLSLFSARHPWRNMASPSPDQLDVLVGLIGKYSIIDRFVVVPGNGRGLIIMESDQNERLILQILTNLASDRDRRSPYRAGTYNLSYQVEFYHPSDPKVTFDHDDRSPRPAVEEVIYEVEKSEILNKLATLLTGLPKMDEITDFPTKFVKFVTESHAVIKISSDAGGRTDINISHQQKNCFNDEDEALMLAFANKIIDDSGYQVRPDTEVVALEVPIIVSDRSSSSCTPPGRSVFFSS